MLRLGFVAVWLLLGAIVVAAGADDENAAWVRLGTLRVTAGADHDVLDLTKAQGRVKAIRVASARAGVDIARLVISYANGQVHFEDRAIHLRAGDRTKAIDERDHERFVDGIEVVYEAGAKTSGNAEIEVWALQTAEGAKATRGPLSVVKPGRAAGDASAGERIARAELPLDVDRDVIVLPAGAGRLERLSFSSDGRVRLLAVTVVYSDGSQAVQALDADIEPGQRTRWLPVAGDRLIRELRLAYQPVPGRDRVQLDVYGIAPMDVLDKSAGPGRGGADDPAKQPFVEVPVYFGTNRKLEGKREKNGRPLAMFSSQTGDDLVLGEAVVSVPTRKDREAGAIPRPGWNLVVATIDISGEDPAQHFTVRSIEPLAENDFLDKARSRLAKASNFPNKAFIFVHGYRNSFDDALFRTAQLAHDMGFDGAAFAFSWPSQGTLAGYAHDVKVVPAAREPLKRFIDLVREKTGAQQINLICHSMGAQLLLDALSLYPEPSQGASPMFREIIFATPDVQRDYFAGATKRLALIASAQTLYASEKDWALHVSKQLARGEAPAGYIDTPGAPAVVRGVETIDISAVSQDFFSVHHSDFADRRPIVQDMELMLRGGSHPPELRSPSLYVEVRRPQGRHWQYRVSGAPP